MSLAQPPSYQSSLFSSSPTPFGTFGASGPLSSIDNEYSDSSVQPDPIHAPQGRIPMGAPEFIPAPLSAVGKPSSQIDFARGFGLDVPLESEEEEEDEAENSQVPEEVEDDEDDDVVEGDNTEDMELDTDRYDGEIVEMDDGATTVPQSGFHSRHISKLSAALSLRSVGGNFQGQLSNAQEDGESRADDDEVQNRVEEAQDDEEEREQHLEADPAAEWTGSEDLYLGAETSDDDVGFALFHGLDMISDMLAECRRMVKSIRRRTSTSREERPSRTSSGCSTTTSGRTTTHSQLPSSSR